MESKEVLQLYILPDSGWVGCGGSGGAEGGGDIEVSPVNKRRKSISGLKININ